MTKAPDTILTKEEFTRTVEVMLREARFDDARAFMQEHLEVQPNPKRPFAMDLVLRAQPVDPALEGEVLMGSMNWLSRRLRNAEYRAKVRGAGFDGLRVLVEGDSWAEYPFLLADLFDHIAARRDFAAYSLAEAGDTAEGMDRDGEYRDAIRDERPDVMLISLGGNDLLGDGQLASVLRPHHAGAGAEDLIDWEALEAQVGQVITHLQNILNGAWALDPRLPVLGHGYDEPRPEEGGKWLGKPLARMGISMSQGQDVVALILGRFNDALRDLSRATGGRFTYLNLRGTVGPLASSWKDELHPKSPGFERAAGPVLAVLDAMLQARRDARDAAPQEALIAAVPPAPIAGLPIASLDEATNVNLTAFMRDRDVTRRRAAPGRLAPSLPGNSPRDTPQDTPHDTPQDLAEAWEDLDYLIANLDVEDTPARRRARAELSLTPADGSDYYDGFDERIIGESDLDEFHTLLRGVRAGRAVGKVMIRLPDGRKGSGSGFLVGPGLFLTNNHVLPTAHVAANSEVLFDYQLDVDGLPVAPLRFRITEDIFLTNARLDYSFVSIAAESRQGVALSQFGMLPLLPPSGKALKSERVSIIQHPRGVYKKVALRDNYVLGPSRDFLYYTTDTQRGSSGAPVFNLEWQVAALHHRTVPSRSDPTQFVANRGVRISSILRNVAERAAGSEASARRVAEGLERGRAMGGALPADGTGGGPRGGLVLDGSGAPVSPPVSPPISQGLPDPLPDVGPATGYDDTIMATGPYAGLSVADALAALGHRWQGESAGLSEDFLDEAALSFSPSAARAKLSERGYWLIVDHETGGRAYYDQILKKAPHWPGGQSGVTIGLGYDLGWQSRAQFHADWGGLLTTTQLTRLEAALGKRGEAARQLTQRLKDIRIPFDEAKRVFDARVLPRFVALTWRSLPGEALEALNGDCVAALVSLTFNRGPSWSKSGDRYSEMRKIRTALEARRFADVPYLIRSMKRLWEGKGLDGLLRRRDDEAKLFQDGLARVSEAMTVIVPGGGDDEHDEAIAEGLDVESQPLVELDLELAESGVMAPRLGLEHARWPNPVNHPDQRHLPGETADAGFTLDAGLIGRLIAAGDYAPVTDGHGRLILGLRGCQFAGGVGQGGKVEHQAQVALMPTSPDHERFRCLIGVVDMATGLISLYRGSTVPRRTGMLRYYNRKNFGEAGPNCNLLPTGCYEYCVGTHRSQSMGGVSHVLRLGTGPEPKDRSAATVLRTANDLIYGTQDLWDHTRPADNIHPAFLTNSFSSLGCLTVEGSQKGFDAPVSTATGPWADFQRAAGFDGRNYGERFDLLLTTGHEAATLAAGHDAPCLRHGSQGDRVRHLQGLLGVTVDGDFGPATRKALADRQNAELGHATGAWSPMAAEELNLPFAP